MLAINIGKFLNTDMKFLLMLEVFTACFTLINVDVNFTSVNINIYPNPQKYVI
jgi:hypothetical protein